VPVPKPQILAARGLRPPELTGRGRFADRCSGDVGPGMLDDADMRTLMREWREMRDLAHDRAVPRSGRRVTGRETHRIPVLARRQGQGGHGDAHTTNGVTTGQPGAQRHGSHYTKTGLQPR